MNDTRWGRVFAMGIGVLVLICCYGIQADETKVTRTIHGSSSNPISLLGWHSDAITISGTPEASTVQSITIRIQGYCDYGDFLAFELTDDLSTYTYSVDTAGWAYDVGEFDETITNITALNGLPVNQIWTLWGTSYSSGSGEYVTRWDIWITYDNGVVVNPDLVVQTSNCVPLSLAVNEPLSLSATISNNGEAFSDASTATWYLATHATPTASDVVLASKEIPSLGISATSEFTQTVSTLSIPGTYNIALKADSGDTNAESNEDNNWGAVFTVMVHPENVITVVPAGFIEEGTRVTMTAPPGSGYVWSKGGIAMTDDAPRVLGVNAQQLVLDTAIEADSGVYTCTYDDGIKAVATTNAYTLNVVARGHLPVAGPCALAILAALLGGVGIAHRRKS